MNIVVGLLTNGELGDYSEGNTITIDQTGDGVGWYTGLDNSGIHCRAEWHHGGVDRAVMPRRNSTCSPCSSMNTAMPWDWRIFRTVFRRAR